MSVTLPEVADIMHHGGGAVTQIGNLYPMIAIGHML